MLMNFFIILRSLELEIMIETMCLKSAKGFACWRPSKGYIVNTPINEIIIYILFSKGFLIPMGAYNSGEGASV